MDMLKQLQQLICQYKILRDKLLTKTLMIMDRTAHVCVSKYVEHHTEFISLRTDVDLSDLIDNTPLRILRLRYGYEIISFSIEFYTEQIDEINARFGIFANYNPLFDRYYYYNNGNLKITNTASFNPTTLDGYLIVASIGERLIELAEKSVDTAIKEKIKQMNDTKNKEEVGGTQRV